MMMHCSNPNPPSTFDDHDEDQRVGLQRLSPLPPFSPSSKLVYFCLADCNGFHWYPLRVSSNVESPRTSTMTISNFPTTTLVFLFTKTTMKGSQLIQSLIGRGGKINFFEKRNPNFLIGVLWYSTPSVLHQLEKSNCYIHGASLFKALQRISGRML
ncbi:uncharacterized protein LOC114257329 isoform X2 [Camellia sinensis]|uniref:uncharacterized protein LOC114257329 isoform X2 n=1 Tax=Camellia sinensis TaxID=4442 RepID=UPI001036398D|nr:uncharacterized protein LOC114257329 isoform X2 [Camellia sinensis]